MTIVKMQWIRTTAGATATSLIQSNFFMVAAGDPQRSARRMRSMRTILVSPWLVTGGPKLGKPLLPQLRSPVHLGMY
jgi:hypothetical protein